jgi:type II restriction/modification system DNA methylase subunit YeeA
LLATQGIRGGANRKVLERIKETGDIFWAQSDRDWILDGAAVHVSMIGFDNGSEWFHMLNDTPVSAINADLTSALDLTIAKLLQENTGLSFMGDTKGGAFDITNDVAMKMINAPLNPNGHPNSDVLRPWINGMDLTGRPRGMWIIDFAVDMSEEEAALYEAPFAYLLKHVKPIRLSSRTTRMEWWLHERPRPEMRAAIAQLPRYIVTPRVSKYRLFIWVSTNTLADSATIAIARDDDYFFGVLHSKVHELWARRKGTQLREAESGFRYTPTTTFETFPFPWPPNKESKDDLRVKAIAQAARDLIEKRDAWLNPEGATETELKKRTLTNLYNQRPTWLDLAHRKLDDAVLDAYGWPHDLSDQEILSRLLALNLQRVKSNQP